MQANAWKQEDVPLHPIEGLDHGTILSAPSPALVQLVVNGLRVSSRPAYQRWRTDADRAVRVAQDAMVPWQQFLVRAVDERGDGIRDWNLQLALADGASLTPFTQDVHVYKADPSYRCFHVNLSKLGDPALLTARPRRLHAQLFASTGTQRVLYTGALVDPASTEPPNRGGTWRGSLDLSSVLPGGALRFFYPLTTTFVQLRLDRDPLTGDGMVIRVDPS